ncbi:MAG: transglycosylase domain-containing protein [Chloroflexi bacterium]|nr:transglycosylase domain-containing protein [Chloroflexota bacterium]
MAEQRNRRANNGQPLPSRLAGLPPFSDNPAPPPLPQAPHLPRPPLPPRKRRQRIGGVPRGCLLLMAGMLLSLCGGLSLLTIGAASLILPRVEAAWSARIAEVDNYRSFASTFIYDRNGAELYEAFEEGRRVHVGIEQVPQSLIDATIAVEDSSFYKNIGIDVPATVVAALSYLGAGRDTSPGGSTITQQLVRNIFFDYEKRLQRSVARKLEEILLALVLTQAKSKAEILEMYLNEIYYGNLAYGVQTAAQTFFGKDVDQINLGEAALLAGLPQAPAWLDPLNSDPTVQAAVDARWRLVLGEMVEENHITQSQARDTLQAGLTFVPGKASLTAPHFTIYALGELERLLLGLGYTPDDILGGGLRVYTTLDLAVNQLAQQAAANQVAQLQRNKVSNAAVVVTKPASGEIIAMVGSIDYENEAIDGSVNVSTAFRQPGSTIKPFTYAAAIERGVSPLDVLWDTPTEIAVPGQPVYAPRNFDNRFHGPMTMRAALANSYNIPAVQTLRLVGVEYLLDMLRRFGIDTLADDAASYGLSLTLGGGEITLIELTNAFAVFANGGDYVPVTAIRCVLDSAARIVYQYDGGCPRGQGTAQSTLREAEAMRVLDPRIAFLINDILGDNEARAPAMGAYSPLRTDGIISAVKTGTTDDVKDNWTVGYTRNVAVGVWVGNNDGEPMRDTSGLTGAAPIWNNVLRGIYGNDTRRSAFAIDGRLLSDQINPPPGMSRRQVCEASRLTIGAIDCPAYVGEWSLEGPAGIPDSAGNLHYPPLPQRYPTPQPTSGSVVVEVSPGVYSTLAYPLPPELAASIQFRVAPGDLPPIPPNFCRVPIEDQAEAIAAGAQTLLFVAGPATSQPDAVAAERYAREHSLAYLPTIDCWRDVYQQQRFGNVGAQLQITQPRSWQSVSQPIPIVGSAVFDTSQADYYLFYIRGGQFADFTPLEHAVYESRSDAPLATLHANSLLPGNYVLRLALHKAERIVQATDVLFVVP